MQISKCQNNGCAIHTSSILYVPQVAAARNLSQKLEIITES